MGQIQFMDEVQSEDQSEEMLAYLTILQKMDFAAKHGCPAGFITKHDIQDTQLAFGLTTEINNERI
jgi:hypothetical protein